METLINPNQIRDGGSSKEIKILNVVQTGTLTRDGAVFSGFSRNNYLQLGARVDKGILSLDSSTYYKDLKTVLPTADNWEMVFKVKIGEIINDNQTIFSDGWTNGYASWVHLYNNILTVGLSVTTSDSYSIGEISGTSIFSEGDVVFVKWGFTGTKYYLQSSLDGITWTNEGEIPSEQKLTRTANINYHFGNNNTTEFNWLGSIDIGGCYIKINGEYWWKGVETL